ncbi:MAG: hypothetical protein ACJ8GW_02555 [Massilia sp.]
MRRLPTTLCTVLLISAVSLPAHAAKPKRASATSERTMASETSTTVAAPNALAPKQLPKLVLSWDCGKCEQNEKVLPLIEQSYAEQASAAGFAISDSETAEVAITEFRQRKPGLRVMLGIMAGRDILATRIKFRGAETVAKDTSSNALQGMNSLCANVAKQLTEQLVGSVQAK